MFKVQTICFCINKSGNTTTHTNMLIFLHYQHMLNFYMKIKAWRKSWYASKAQSLIFM